jgi:hypothetical protein
MSLKKDTIASELTVCQKVDENIREADENFQNE